MGAMMFEKVWNQFFDCSGSGFHLRSLSPSLSLSLSLSLSPSLSLYPDFMCHALFVHASSTKELSLENKTELTLKI